MSWTRAMFGYQSQDRMSLAVMSETGLFESGFQQDLNNSGIFKSSAHLDLTPVLSLVSCTRCQA